jgi:hypothetical protein
MLVPAKVESGPRDGFAPVRSEPITERAAWYLALFLVFSWCPALFIHHIVGQVSAMHKLAAEPNPYFLPAHGWLLYAVIPLVTVSSFSLFLSPGGILALAFGTIRSAAEWVVLAFGASLLLCVFLSTGGKLSLGLPLGSAAFLSLWLVAAVVALAFLIFQVRRRGEISWPLSQVIEWRRILWVAAVVVLGVIVLTPKIFWENFNVDGIEAFEFGRSLSRHVLPHWEIQDGVFGFYHNFLLFAYPNHWFITLFGPVEAAARLPFLLYLIVLFASVLLLIEWMSARQLSAIEETVLWLGLALYSVVQVYNTNYEPFFADIAEMAATDTLWVTCFVCACYALWSSRIGWFWIFALMTYTASPGGLLLLAALAPVTFFSRSPQRLQQLKSLGKIIVVCLLIGVAYEVLYNPLVIGDVNNQFSTKNMLRRLYPPTVTEFVRFNALVFPSGILPALSLLAVRRTDPAGWMIGGVTAVYFGAIYLQAWTSLHQFTPVMILPIIVFWRLYLESSSAVQRWLLPTLACTTIVSFFLSLPRHFQINLAIREFGEATLYKVGDYDRSYERAVRGAWSLSALLPAGYRLQYPEQPWGADALSWIYYATREKPAGTTINYVVQEASEPTPRGATRVGAREGVSVYVQDLAAWRHDQVRELPRIVVSPLYEPILRRTYQFFRAYAERMQKTSPSLVYPLSQAKGLD